jgi:hypothetical protein
MKRRIVMTLEDALDIVSSETERSLLGLNHGVDRNKIKWALEEVEQAVHRLIRIENDIIKVIKNNELRVSHLNGASNIIIEDDSVRSES